MQQDRQQQKQEHIMDRIKFIEMNTKSNWL